MRILYKIFTKFYTLLLDQVFLVKRTWMFFSQRGGRLGSTNQGWSRVKSFLQETVDKFFQHSPRNGDRPKQKSQVQDAHVLLTDLPTFFIILFCSLNCFSKALLVEKKQFYSLDKNTSPLPIIQNSEKSINDINNKNNNPVEENSTKPILLRSIQHESESRNTKIKKKMRDVAELYEKQFLRDMVKQMRSTVPTTDMFKSSFAETYYREQLDQQYVESWGDKGGIGMGDMIYNELLEKYGPRMGLNQD